MRFIKIFSVLVLFLAVCLCFPKESSATIVFSILNPVVNSNDEVEVDATISGLISSSCSTNGCYLQAELESAGGFFGYTCNNSGEYIDYFKNPSSVDEIKTKLFNFVPVGNAWSGKIKAKNNSLSSNYYGPGNYLLSFRRFSGNSVSATSTDSNSLAVILNLPTPTPVPSNPPENMETPTPSPTNFILKTAVPSISLNPIAKATIQPSVFKTSFPKDNFSTSSVSTSGEISKVLGTESSVNDSPKPFEPIDKKIPVLPIILIAIGVCFIAASIFSIIRNVKKGYTVGDED